MKIHEYQAKELLRAAGLSVPSGRVCETADETAAAYDELGSAVAVVKAQIHAGGRGKGGGVKLVRSREEAREAADAILGMMLKTPQTSAEGQLVRKVWIEEGSDIAKEYYVGVVLDREKSLPVVMASSEGGMDIEEVAETNPDAIVTEAIDIFAGVQPEQTERLARAMGFREENIPEAQAQMSKMYDMFIGEDATQVEINPFAEGKYAGRDEASTVFCVDAKLGFDQNSEYRHKELFAMRDTSMEDARDVEADEIGVEYIGLDGNIGCMVNGAGLAMGTMDIIKLKGGDPANFCDLGGGVNEQQVSAAFGVVSGDPNVKAILVNIFGGIVQCDIVAEGIVNAYRKSSSELPLVVRLEGTNAERAKEIVEAANIPTLISAENLDDAAIKAVAAIA